MLGYCTIGVNDMDRATAFYDDLLGDLGAKSLFGMDRIRFYGTGPGQPMLAICIPYDEEAQAPGNGTMVALAAESEEQVDQLYAKAIELGGTDEGAPGSAPSHVLRRLRPGPGRQQALFLQDVGRIAAVGGRRFAA